MSTWPPSSRLRPFRPTPFGRYILLLPLSTGGMGEIFLARSEGPGGFEKLCVIKKILPPLAQDPVFVERFIHEARTLVKLSHGSIAQVFDMGLHDGSPYLALEYVDGKDLRKVVGRARDRGVPLPLTFSLFVMARVLDALAYAHRKRDDDEREISLVHRDISPQNILVSYEGEVKVIDFGLAKSTLSAAKTHPSIILGKFLYMSPEQAKHQKVDRRADLYSVGLCLYELISGKNPFDEYSAGDLMSVVADPKLRPLSEVDPLCPREVDSMVMKALAVDPNDRFQTAEEFRARIQTLLLEIDAKAGPESVSRYMRETFVQEFGAERKLLSSLRQWVKSGGSAVSSGKEREVETAVFELQEVVQKSVPTALRETAVGLAPAGTPLRRSNGNGAGRASGGRGILEPATTVAMPILGDPGPLHPWETDTGPRTVAGETLPFSDENTNPGSALPTPPLHSPAAVVLVPPRIGVASASPHTSLSRTEETTDSQARVVTRDGPGLPASLTETQPGFRLESEGGDTEPRVLLGTLLEDSDAAMAPQRRTQVLTANSAPPGAFRRHGRLRPLHWVLLAGAVGVIALVLFLVLRSPSGGVSLEKLRAKPGGTAAPPEIELDTPPTVQMGQPELLAPLAPEDPAWEEGVVPEEEEPPSGPPPQPSTKKPAPPPKAAPRKETR